MKRSVHPIRLTRRALLRLGLAGGIVAGGAVVYTETESVGFGNWFRWMVRGQAARFAPLSRVGLASVASYEADLVSAIDSLWRDAGGPDLHGANVVVKPNLVDYIEGRPCFTMPQVIAALLDYVRHELGARSVVVGEGMTFRRDPHATLIQMGYREMLDRAQVDFVDLNYDDLVQVPLRGGYTRLDKLYLARTVAHADALISVPKLKTHHWTGISGSIKNLFGIVPGVKYGFPKNTLHIQGIDQFLAELLDSLPTPMRFAVVDGIVGLQGDGPLFGTAVESHALAAGSDLVAVDATCARLMGFDPMSSPILTFMAWAGLGQINSGRIELRGASLDALRQHYQPAPQV